MGLDGFEQVWIGSDKFRQVHTCLDRFEEVRISSNRFGQVRLRYDRLGQVQIGLDRRTRTLNLITFSTLRNTEGVEGDIDKSCVFVMLHFFVLDAILSNSCRMGNFRSIQVLYRQKNHTMDPCIGSSSFLQHNSSSFYNSFCRCCVEICKGKMYIFFFKGGSKFHLTFEFKRSFKISTHHILTFTNVSNLSKQILLNPKPIRTYLNRSKSI